MKLLNTLLLMVVIVTGCASPSGQVALTRYTPLPEVEPAALPKATDSTPSSKTASVGANPTSRGAFIPLLGQIVIGKEKLGLESRTRGFLSWKDPKRYNVIDPQVTTIAGLDPQGVFSPDGPTLKNTVGVDLSSGDKGIPIGGGASITASVTGSHTLELDNLRTVKINMLDFSYIASLADTAAGGQDVYFISEVLASDVIKDDSVGLNVQYKPLTSPAGTIDPTLKANYESSYRGIGLILGVQMQIVANVGTFKFETLKAGDLGFLKAHRGMDLAEAALSNPSIKQFRAFSSSLDKFSHGKVDASAPFVFNKGSGSATVIFNSPFVGGFVQVFDGTNTVSSNEISLTPGEHIVTFIAMSGNQLYAIKCVLNVLDNFDVQEKIEGRTMHHLSWAAADLNTTK